VFIVVCRVIDLGIIDYKKAYDIQKKYLEEVLDGKEPILLLCEHPTVLTKGRLAKEDNVLLSAEMLKEKCVDVISIDRGGDVTLHTEGQLIAYPIIDLSAYGKDLRKYLYKLEQVVIDLLSDFDIVASRLSGKTGAWIGLKKIASIGIGVRKWVSFHGVAINVNTDLNKFSMINPCGLDVKMTSISEILSSNIEMSKIKRSFIDNFFQQFGIIKGQDYGRN